VERTLIIVKPDGVQRGLVGQVLGRFETRGFRLAGLKMMQISRQLAERHYAEHQGKPFYEGLVAFITSAPAAVGVVEGPGAVAVVRAMMGTTNPANADAGTIRGDFAVTMSYNVIHGSDSLASAEREIALFFDPSELLDYRRASDTWVMDE
jgi:nucleoside-diphosphate kinase